MTAPRFQTVDEGLLDKVEAIARRAGEVILGFYHGAIETQLKADASPVTAADQAAEALIVPALESLLPGVLVVSEEAVAAGEIPDVRAAGDRSGRFWLVDPLDGTKEFISRNGEFTVNIALVDRGRPLLGVVHVPALATTYGGIVPHSARKHHDGGTRAISARKPPSDGL